MKISKKTVGAVAAGLLAMPLVSSGATFNLTDGNSVVNVDPTIQAGAFNWVVDGTDHLFQQWFWVGTGTGAGRTAERSIDTLGSVVANQGSANQLNSTFSGSGMIIDIAYTLFGGSPGDGQSDIAESIRVKNTSGHTETYHFFQYSDFDINGTAANDFAQHRNANAIAQWENGAALSETVDTPAANRWQISSFPILRNQLNDGVATDLANVNNNTAGAVVGPGDMTWAWQWDFTLAAGSSFIISKDKKLSSLPDAGSTLVLLGSAMGALGMMRRKIRAAR